MFCSIIEKQADRYDKDRMRQVNRGRVIFILFIAVFCIHGITDAQERYLFTYPDRSSFLSDGWDFKALGSTGEVRNTEQVTGAVVSFDQEIHPGVMRIPVDEGDLWEGINNTRNTVFRDMPAGWTSMRLKIASFNPTLGNQQATLTAYQDDDNYIQLSRTCEGFNQIMFTSEKSGHAINLVSLPEAATSDIHLRLDRDPLTQVFTAYYSLDGELWKKVGTTVSSLVSTRFAIETGASPGGLPDADFEWAEISTQQLPPVTDSLTVSPASLVFCSVEGKEAPGSGFLYISTAGGSLSGWTWTGDADWLYSSQKSGLTDDILKISVVTRGLKAGIYRADIFLESPQSVAVKLTIPVTLIINPDIPVEATVWKDGRAGAMSVSVDDGQPSGFSDLVSNGFRGTYVTNGYSAPSFYSSYYNSGMELGSHLVNHPCNPVTGEDLRDREIVPNIYGLSRDVPIPENRIISLVWPCGYTNYMEQSIASQYFLSARGYNINRLEDQTPHNFMDLKSYNSHEHIPFPPSDLKNLVDSAIIQNKWFNLVLHNLANDDGAINYAAKKDIWVAPIGTVIKYILQRDRLIYEGFNEDAGGITFSLSRLELPSTPVRNFEEAFLPEDIVTLKVDIDDSRLVEKVLIGGVMNEFITKVCDGNRFLLTDVRPESGISKQVEIFYRDQPAIKLIMSDDTIEYNTLVNRNPMSRSLALLTATSEPAGWNSTVIDGLANWDIRLSPSSGMLNDTIGIFVECKGLPPGDYTKKVSINSPDGKFYPVDIDIFLHIRNNILRQNYPNPFGISTWIEYDLPEDGPVTLEIYSSLGAKCQVLISANQLSGRHMVKWEPVSLPSGTYFLMLRTKNFRETIRMSYIK